MRLPSGPRGNRLPEILDGVPGAAIDIDHAGMALGAIADESAGVFTGQIDAQRHARDEVGVIGIDQPLQFMQRFELVHIENGVAGAKANLRQPRSLAQQHGKCFRTDLGIKRAVITGADHVEPPRAVGDHPREHVEPPGRAFGLAAATISGGSARLSSNGTM